MCMILREIYRSIYLEDFVYENLEDRIKLQKAVYLLENMGLNVGDYSFSWAKYGPYSPHLDGDARFCMTKKPGKVHFSEQANKAFTKVKDMLEIPHDPYSTRYWIEDIASIHFLRNVCHYSEEKALSVLVKQKKYLNNRSLNTQAAQLANMISLS